jgi:hypothetical protein
MSSVERQKGAPVSKQVIVRSFTSQVKMYIIYYSDKIAILKGPIARILSLKSLITFLNILSGDQENLMVFGHWQDCLP